MYISVWWFSPKLLKVELSESALFRLRVSVLVVTTHITLTSTVSGLTSPTYHQGTTRSRWVGLRNKTGLELETHVLFAHISPRWQWTRTGSSRSPTSPTTRCGATSDTQEATCRQETAGSQRKVGSLSVTEQKSSTGPNPQTLRYSHWLPLQLR